MIIPQELQSSLRLQTEYILTIRLFVSYPFVTYCYTVRYCCCTKIKLMSKKIPLKIVSTWNPYSLDSVLRNNSKRKEEYRSSIVRMI